jgi:hypothetical protein
MKIKYILQNEQIPPYYMESKEENSNERNKKQDIQLGIYKENYSNLSYTYKGIYKKNYSSRPLKLLSLRIRMLYKMIFASSPASIEAKEDWHNALKGYRLIAVYQASTSNRITSEKHD